MTTADTVLVTGATGFVGSAIVEALDERFVCRRGVRVAPTDASGALYFAYGDMTEASFGRDLSLQGIDVLVHCAGSAHSRPTSDVQRATFEAVNVHATKTLAQIAKRDGVRHVILLSSIGVLGPSENSGVLSDFSPAAPAEYYAQTKYDGEQALVRALEDTTVRYTVLRPTMIYGNGNPGNPGMLQQLIRKLPVVPLGAVRNRRSFIFVDNLAGLIQKIITARPSENAVHVVADPWVVSTADFVRALARREDPLRRVVNISPALLRLGAWLVGRPDLARKLLGNLEVDSSTVWERYGARPAFTFEQSFDRMFEADKMLRQEQRDHQ